jgi:DNA-binding NtrC family response regulator
MAAKVLVVDDEQRITDSLRQILEGAGYQVACAYSPGQALVAAARSTPDVLLSDILMPEMNGFELALEVKKRFPDCRLILFSGQAATEELAHQFIGVFAAKGLRFELLPKPVHPDVLLKKIEIELRYSG